MDIFAVRQGTALDLTVTLTDDQGDPITTYDGTEALAATVWPGGSLASSFSPQVAWRLAPAGQVNIGITAAQTATLEEGRYRGTLELQDPALGWLEASSWAMDVLLGPGSGKVAPSYCSFPDLLRYGRAWLRNLQTEDDDAGFSEQCGRARSWLDDTIIAGWQTYYSLNLGDPGYGAVLVGQGTGQLPSVWLRQQLDADALIVRDLVREIAAKKALAFICEGQLGVGEAAEQYAKLGRRYHWDAAQLCKTLRAEIDTIGPGIGPPQFAVNLGQSSMRG